MPFSSKFHQPVTLGSHSGGWNEPCVSCPRFRASSLSQTEMPFLTLEEKQIMSLSRLLLRTSCSRPYWLGLCEKKNNQTKLFPLDFIILFCPAGTSPDCNPNSSPNLNALEFVKIPVNFRLTAILFKKSDSDSWRIWGKQLHSAKPQGEEGEGKINLQDMKFGPLSKHLIASEGQRPWSPKSALTPVTIPEWTQGNWSTQYRPDVPTY